MGLTLIEAPGLACFSSNEVLYSLHTDFDPNDLPKNYQILVKVMLTNEVGDFYEVVELDNLTPDSAGNVSFDLSDIIDSEIRTQFIEPPLPDMDLNDPQVIPITRMFRISYAERYGQPPTTEDFTDDDDRYVILAGLDRSRYHIHYLQDITIEDSILSWQPNYRKVGIDQKLWYNWINASESETEIEVRIKLYGFNMGLGGSVSASYSGGTIPAFGCLAVPVNYTWLLEKVSLAANEAHHRFDVQLYASGEPASPLRTWFLDHSYYEQNRQHIYFNGFTMPESVRLRGEFQKNLKLSRTESKKIQRRGLGASSRDMIQTSVDWDNPCTYRTGYISKEEKDALQEMLVYNTSFEFKDGKLKSLYIIDEDFTVVESTTFLDSLEFKAVDAYKKKHIPMTSLT